MDSGRCEHEGCHEEWQFSLSDREEGETHYFCEQHFLIACATYLFAAAVNNVPDKERLIARHNGLYVVLEGVELG